MVARSDALRKLVGAFLAATVLAAAAVAPVAAEVELCIIDPTVTVDGTAIQVGLYTRDASLVAPGGVPADLPILVTVLGSGTDRISTAAADWQQSRPNTAVTVLNVLPDRSTGNDTVVEIDAFVPSTVPGDSFSIQVTLPDHSVKTASGRVNTLVRLRVAVPVRP
jgi:hypothetical protein